MSLFSELILTEKTRKDARKYLDSPTHALLVVGSKGNGIAELVSALASERLGIEDVSTLENTPRAQVIYPNKNGNISIDEIRSAWKFAKVAGAKGNDKTKLVVIHDAHALTTEAQNSLLKLLEEPPEYLSFILSAPSTRSVLSTIDSRTRKLTLSSVTEDEFKTAMTGQGVKGVDVQKLWVVSSGEVYKALGMSKQDSGEGLGFSKELLSMKPFDRLIEAKGAMSDRSKALVIVRDIYHLAFIALKGSIASGKNGKNWLAILKKTERTIRNLEANGNVRLNLTNLLTDI